MSKLSVVLATYQEEGNLKDCLESVKNIASEIVVVDGGSIDATVEIAKSCNAKVVVTDNPAIFHINKQKAIDLATHEWILQLDADERVSPSLESEIAKVIKLEDGEIEKYQDQIKDRRLFLRHQQLLEQRDGPIGTEAGQYAAFFIPRLNYFLGGYLRYGGVYPDGVIRLIKKGLAYLPAKDVHEQMVVKGRVGWLQNNLIHRDSPTFVRYLERNSRYISLLAGELARKNEGTGLISSVKYFLWLPISTFLSMLIRHKGILDGYRGLIFAFFSALRFPRAYLRYLTRKR